MFPIPGSEPDNPKPFSPKENPKEAPSPGWFESPYTTL